MRGVQELVAAAAALVCLALAPASQAATIQVDATADDFGDNLATCALREAVESAVFNAVMGGCSAEAGTAFGVGVTDTITLGAGDHVLDRVPINEDVNGGGDIDFRAGGPAGPIVIRGLGSATTVSTTLDDRIFHLPGAQTLTLEDLKVANGDVGGFGGGGGIDAEVAGTVLTLRRVTVSDGLGISGGGVVLGGAGSRLEVTDSVFEGNDSETSGGAIVLFVAVESANIARTSFLDNHAIRDGTGESLGGAIQHAGGDLTVTDSSFVGNSASTIDAVDGDHADGGAIYSSDPLTVRRTLFQSNTVNAARDDASAAELGGAIYSFGTPVIENSTFFGNLAGIGAGSEHGEGGALYKTGLGGTTMVSHSTFQGNLANLATGGDHLHNDPGSGLLRFESSILDAADNPCGGFSSTSGGGNVSVAPDPECDFGSQEDDTGPVGLAAGGPTDNGGPTDTIALQATSKALDLVAGGQCADTDQRGFLRELGGNKCDGGAYERITCRGRLAGVGTVFGTDDANKITGTAAANTIFGLGGNDAINPRGGNDAICAGKGKDTLSFASGGAVRVRWPAGTATGQGSDTFEDVEILVGSPLTDLLIGNTMGNIIRAGKGKDTVRGRGGNDTLSGQAGNDRLFGNAGRDRLLGGRGRDRLRGGPGRDILRGGPGRDLQVQ